MTEKYKIYIPEEMKSRLMNDAELFEFYKADGTVNLNAFLKEVLISYYDQYRAAKEQLLDTILADLCSFSSISKKDAVAIADRIVNTYMQNSEYKAQRNTALTLTVSGDSLDIMQSIENNMLANVSLSQYLNDLFSSYLSISRKDREKVIFRDTFEELKLAINRNSIITFSSSSAKGAKFKVRPYMIAASKEEQCNYLLCADDSTGIPRTFRISRIRALFTSSDRFTPDETVKAELQEVALRSPQSASKAVEAKVRLTDKGIEKFKVVTKNRPDVLRRDGHTYCFNWPLRALEDYFKRFGKDALIISPAESLDSMKYFYERALDAYKKIKKSMAD